MTSVNRTPVIVLLDVSIGTLVVMTTIFVLLILALLKGKCVHKDVECDDHDACTCDKNSDYCEYSHVSCDDYNACTEDGCDCQNGCYHNPISCDDACTEETSNRGLQKDWIST